jgi:ribosomal protein S18 acetylase RimI-like enzyme
VVGWQTDAVGDARVEVLRAVDEEAVDALRRLLPQVSSTAPRLPRERVEAVLANPSTHVLIARLDGRIVGMSLLLVLSTLAGDFGYVEEVAVDDSVRGQHVGRDLTLALLQLARDLGLRFVDLTSRPSRATANALYQSLGFELRETNCYRHAIREGK